MQNNRITELFGIEYSIIQGGMVWVSGYKLASAVSNAGGLGLIGAGSMYPDVFREHIQKCKKATNKPFGVNLPLIYPDIDKMVAIVIEEGVQVVFTSAGNPNTWTSKLKAHGITVVHVVSSIKFALKAQEAGVDAVVAEGFEAGGHNGREETTTFTLIPMVKEQISIPLIAAGGIASGRGILAAEVLGADGVQIGSRFAVSEESSAHIKYKELITELQDGATQLTFKELAPVRIVKNNYYQKLLDLYKTHPTKETLQVFYNEAKLKTGIFEGDVVDGKIEIGQIAGLIHQVQSIKEIMSDMITEYQAVKKQLN
ncbi:NAD(P)H-dependent flavin oxidoreductase [Wenyingzhuangia aestuarii]|uniref:NAD(P)H-dependent flavin oxidoreductase n=1 Tax=Wenyingzhuangia aestuarii TaxID=1647582 RepID=UPI001439BA15|nr:nitronate monooxygenase [Wenyingzhuangia aestuarii]NJB83848.1 enoyl-[acyl-carrier protein] reductase II [Wenyingzhuangia aestuarii]